MCKKAVFFEKSVCCWSYPVAPRKTDYEVLAEEKFSDRVHITSRASVCLRGCCPNASASFEREMLRKGSQSSGSYPLSELQMMNLTWFLRLPWLLLRTLKRFGRSRIFMVPSAPQEKM